MEFELLFITKYYYDDINIRDLYNINDPYKRTKYIMNCIEQGYLNRYFKENYFIFLDSIYENPQYWTYMNYEIMKFNIKDNIENDNYYERNKIVNKYIYNKYNKELKEQYKEIIKKLLYKINKYNNILKVIKKEIRR